MTGDDDDDDNDDVRISVSKVVAPSAGSMKHSPLHDSVRGCIQKFPD